eukprot:5777823-Pleurochrysis_carterae.AAC.1
MSRHTHVHARPHHVQRSGRVMRSRTCPSPRARAAACSASSQARTRPSLFGAPCALRGGHAPSTHVTRCSPHPGRNRPTNHARQDKKPQTPLRAEAKGVAARLRSMCRTLLRSHS